MPRAAILRLSFIIGLSCLAWAALVFVSGGIDVHLLGLKITSHDPLKPLLAAALALTVRVLAGGTIPLGWIDVAARPLQRIRHQHIAWPLAIAIVALGVTYGTRAIGGSDSYGYVTEAELWLQGRLTVDQSFAKEAPWPLAPYTFAPKAYTAWTRDTRFIVPLCAPGLPLLLAAAKLIGGQAAMFWIMPLGAGALVLGTYYLGRRLGSGTAGAIAAWLVATSPPVLFLTMTTMTDVPNAALWAAAFYVWLGRSKWREFGAGLLCSAAVMVRPNLAPLVAFIALGIVLRAGAWSRLAGTIGRVGLFSLGVLPGAVMVAAFNAHIFGSPFSQGTGAFSDLFAWPRVWPNMRNYVGFFLELHTPIVLAGVFAIFVPLRWIWPGVPDRRIFIPIGVFVAAVWFLYFGFDVLNNWWYLRFMLPTWPFIMTGVGAVLVALMRVIGPRMRAAVICGIIALGILQLQLGKRRLVWEIGRGESRFIVAAQLARRITPPNSVILAVQHAGSVRYYGGRMTMRFDLIEPEWLDRTVEWLTAHGAHTYLLVEDSEIDEVRGLFTNARRLRALDAGPIGIYRDPGNLFIYDLSEPDASRVSGTVTVTGLNTGAGWGAVGPAPHEPFVIK